MIALTRQSPRAAHHINSTKLARPRRPPALARNRRILRIELYVPRNEQIQKSITVVIAPSRARRPSSQRHSRLLRHIGKSSIVIVVVKPVLSKIGNINIRPAIVIVVTHNRAKSPTLVGHSGLVGHIGKSSIMIVME